MDKYRRHLITWKLLYKLLSRPLERIFRMTHEDIEAEGPCIIIPNHVNMWDPILVGLSMEKKHAYFVASEHLFRKGIKTRALNYLLEPIARKKATTATDTVKACLRHLKAGHSICLFGEGEASWNGVNNKVFPATGKLVKASGASLVTYRLEGGYLTRPRWAKKVRRGKLHGHPVKVYSPEQLKQMTPQEINEAISADICEDAWARQRAEQVRYKGKNLAESIETALFMCPKCRRIGTLKSAGDRVACTCGYETRYTETGFFDPPEPFEDIYQWDVWQHEQLKEGSFPHGEELFSDGNIRLTKIGTDHREKLICVSRLTQYEDRLQCGDAVFYLKDIDKMDMVQTSMLLFGTEGGNYQLFAQRPANLRKYLAVFRQRQ